MILSFELPFALIPLLKFSSSSTKMGPHKNSVHVSSEIWIVLQNALDFLIVYAYRLCKNYAWVQIIVLSWILGFGVMSINIYYLATGYVNWLIHNDLPKVGNVFIGIIVFPLMAIYLIAVLYLTFRKDTVVTFIVPEKDYRSDPTNMEKKLHNSNQILFELNHLSA